LEEDGFVHKYAAADKVCKAVVVRSAAESALLGTIWVHANFPMYRWLFILYLLIYPHTVLCQNLPVDDIYLISLDKAADRRARVCEMLDATGYQYRLFSAIDGKQITASQLLKYQQAGWVHSRSCRQMRTSGELGCALSHLHVLDDFLKRNLSSALIFEDDVQLAPGFWSNFSSMFADIPTDYDIVYLGVTHDKCAHNADKIISPHVTKLKWSLCLHGYIVSRAFVNKLFNHFLPLEHNLDVHIAYKADSFQSYLFFPSMATQHWDGVSARTYVQEFVDIDGCPEGWTEMDQTSSLDRYLENCLCLYSCVVTIRYYYYMM